MKQRKANLFRRLLRRNCFWKHVIKKIEGIGSGGSRRKQLLDDLKETRGYYKLKEEALDRNVWRTLFGRRYGPVVKNRLGDDDDDDDDDDDNDDNTPSALLIPCLDPT